MKKSFFQHLGYLQAVSLEDETEADKDALVSLVLVVMYVDNVTKLMYLIIFFSCLCSVARSIILSPLIPSHLPTPQQLAVYLELAVIHSMLHGTCL